MTATLDTGRGLVPVVAMALLLMLAAFPALSSDPPHWYSSTIDIGCGEQCHATHNSAGGQLTQADGNVNLCQSCHASGQLADGLPVDSIDRASPLDEIGIHHAFDVPAVNATYSTQEPLDNDMKLRIMDGNIVCSSCHNQHKNFATNGGRARIGAAARVGGVGGSLTPGGTFSGTNGMWYLVEIDSAGALGSATFRWSLDNGTTWMQTGIADGNGSPVVLTGGFGVEVTFGAGTYSVGDSWEFSAAYPFLRTSLTDVDGDSAICRDCHRDWVMTHTDVRVDGHPTGGGSGVSVYKSHPVGVTLNVNGQGYDRAEPLDGNGQPLIGGADQDGNPSNDLRLDSGGRVHCLSCHGVHYTDDNTLTVDQP